MAGRHPRPGGKRNPIPVRVAPAANAEIARVAADLGMTRSDFVRQAIERAVFEATGQQIST